eukprot:1905843-Ditylum_brightwellii.AAC.1
MHSKKLGCPRKKGRKDIHDNQRTASSVNDSSTLHVIDENNVNGHSSTLDTSNNLSVGFNSPYDSSEDTVNALSNSLSESNHASVNTNEEFTSIDQSTTPIMSQDSTFDANNNPASSPTQRTKKI